MDWRQIVAMGTYTQSPNEEQDLERLKQLIYRFNLKYGNYEYTRENDLRVRFLEEFEAFFLSLTKQIPGNDVLLIGAASGFELQYLNQFNVVSTDIANCGLQQIPSNISFRVQSRSENLPFPSDSVDAVIGLRVFQSSRLRIEPSIREIARVLKPEGKAILSISNGYVMRSDKGFKVQKGLFDSNGKFFNEKRPYILTKATVVAMGDLFENIQIEKEAVRSEIFITADKKTLEP